MGLRMKTGEVAEAFDVTRRTVTNWKAAGCPVQSVGGRGKEDVYDSAQVHGWLVAQALGDGAAKDPETRQMRLEILKVEKELRQLRLKKQTGELIETNAVDFTMRDSFIGIKSAFRSLVPHLATELLSLDKKSDMRRFCYQIDERLDIAIFSVYVALCRVLAELAGRSGGKAERMAAEAWKAAFGGDWSAEYDRLVQSGAVKMDDAEKPARRGAKKGEKK